MSFRDLRNITEMLRALGFPRPVSLENFRQPNFKLVAEILVWLVKSFDPEADIPTDIELEADRVLFIKAAAQFMATKAHVKMNPKKLYQADGYAVKEMIKAISVLYGALKDTFAGPDRSEDDDASKVSLSDFDMSSRARDLKQTRLLASQITNRGAELYDLLGREVELRSERLSAIARPLEVDKVEKGVRQGIAAVNDKIQETYKMLDNLASDEANLDHKMKNKRAELERNQKRLRSLQRTRPGFMDEYEKLEVELASCYEQYIAKHRNLDYLEHQLEVYNQAEQDRFEETEETLKRMQDRLRQDEMRLIRGEGDLDALVIDDDEGEEGDDYEDGPLQRGGGGGGGGGGGRYASAERGLPAGNKTAKNSGHMGGLSDSEPSGTDDSDSLGLSDEGDDDLLGDGSLGDSGDDDF